MDATYSTKVALGQNEQAKIIRDYCKDNPEEVYIVKNMALQRVGIALISDIDGDGNIDTVITFDANINHPANSYFKYVFIYENSIMSLQMLYRNEYPNIPSVRTIEA